MGLLDDLEKRAGDQRDTERSVEEHRRDQERFYRRETEPVMRGLYEYLGRLVEQLNYLKQEKTASYDIPGYGPLEFELSPEYQLKTELEKWNCSVTLSTSAILEAERATTVTITGHPKVKSLISTLQRLRIAGNAKGKKNDKGEYEMATFTIHGKIPMCIKLSANVESEKIAFECENFKDLATTKRWFSPDAFTESIKDQLGKFVAREDDGFLQEEISDELRHQLRKRVEKNEIRRKWEERLSVEPPPGDQPATEKNPKTAGFFSRLIGRGKQT